MIKVSIIIPVYNVEKYIIRCIQSVMNQTYAYIECIIVDDCTPDRSMNIIDNMLMTYSGPINFVILQHSVNRGLSAARNTGTYRASGDYVYYLDSDDEIRFDCIERLVEVVSRYPDVEVIQGNTKTIPYVKKEKWRDISKQGFPLYIHDNLWCRKHFYKLFNRHGCIPMNAWNKLIKLNFIRRYNLYFKENIIHEDELWMFYVIKNIVSIAFCYHKVYIHYIVPGSIIQANNKLKSLYSWYIILDEMYNNLEGILYRQQLHEISWLLLYKYASSIRYVDRNISRRYLLLVNEVIKKEGISTNCFFYWVKTLIEKTNSVFISRCLKLCIQGYFYLQSK